MNKDKPVKMRKPSEMTEQETMTANEKLPMNLRYVPKLGLVQVHYGSVYLSDLKKFFDYLTSINVDPYATR